MKLRPYQRAAIDATTAYLREHDDNPVIVLPTGAGKSVVMATMIREYLEAWPQTRIAILAHVRELIEQNAQKLADVWPEAPLGIYSAGLGRRQAWAPVLFASIQSVAKRARELGRFDLVLVDEAHRIPIRGEGLYRRFLADATELNPHLRVIGYTATPYRLGHGMVIGPDSLLNGIGYEADLAQLIADGYLCRLVSKGGRARADLSGVHVRNGEFIARELEAAVDQDDIVERAVDEIIELCHDRRAWLLFCAGVAHAQHVSEALARRSVEAPVIHAGTSTAERDEIINRYRNGDLRALCNVNVLSEGFDAPHVDAVILLRPTKSAGLYYQQVGRGLRLHPGKPDCLVLDFAGNIAEHGPVDSIKVRAKRSAGESATEGAPTKECPECQAIVLIAVMLCPECGHVWESKPAHDDTASGVPILSSWREPEWLEVSSVSYARHDKPGKTPSLRVLYRCGFSLHQEWICVEHEGFPKAQADRWWRSRSRRHQLSPDTVDEALLLSGELDKPIEIKVDTNERYPRIVAYRFAYSNAEGAHDRRSGAADRVPTRATR